MHFQRSPTCFQFVRRAHATPAQPAGQKRVDTTFDETVFTSTKRPKPLRCHVVNDISHCASATSLTVLPNLPSELEVDDNNDAPFANVDDIQMLLEADVNDIQVLGDNADDDSGACPTRNDTPSGTPFMVSTDQKWTISLLKILDDMNAPDYAFAAVLKCHWL